MKIEFWRLINTIFLIIWLILFMMFFHYVSIGSKIGDDCCNGSKAEQFWNLGIFVAILSAFLYFFDLYLENSYFNKPEYELEPKDLNSIPTYDNK